MRGFVVALIVSQVVPSVNTYAAPPCKPNMVRVRVLDMNGAPVPYANVFALHTRIGDGTDKSGWATLAGLPGDSVTIKVRLIANGARVRVLPDSCGAESVVVRLGPARKLRWVSSDIAFDESDSLDAPEGNCEALIIASDTETGRPMVGAVIIATSLGYTNEHAVATDSLGHAIVRYLHIGRYSLRLCHNWYGGYSEEREVWAGKVDTVHVSLRAIGPPKDGRRCETYYRVPVGASD